MVGPNFWQEVSEVDELDNECISIFIPGNPKTKGSWRQMINKHTGKQFMKPECPESEDWQSHVAYWVASAHNGQLIDEPVEIILGFFFLRPKSHYGTGKNKNKIKPSAPKYMAIKRRYDIDKLERPILDALEGTVYTNDSLVCVSKKKKVYCDADQVPGVYIELKKLE